MHESGVGRNWSWRSLSDPRNGHENGRYRRAAPRRAPLTDPLTDMSRLQLAWVGLQIGYPENISV